MSSRNPDVLTHTVENLFMWDSRKGKIQNLILSYDITGQHYSDVIMDAVASPITSLTIVYSTVYSGADQRNHQSSASLAFVRGFHRCPVNSPHKWPVTRKMFPFDDVVMKDRQIQSCHHRLPYTDDLL